jgi:three-Cys-motif partner protein
MAQKIKIDAADGLLVDEVGPWAEEKHERLRKYIDASRGARAAFVPPRGTGGAAYIDLFSGPGRSNIRDTSRIIDGSPLVAYRSAYASRIRFSEIHLADFDEVKVGAAVQRIANLGGAALPYTGPAERTVDEIVAAVNPHGLHFAFLDPYNLEALPFSVIERLSRLKRIDMLIHVSLQDLQRNLSPHLEPGGALDVFMPGWRESVDANRSFHALRAALLRYWLGKIRRLGTSPAEGIELVVGSRNQRLYWLVFVSAHDLGQKLWQGIRDVRGQGSLGF